MKKFLPLFLLLAGCPLLHLEVAVEEVCVSQTGIEVSAAPVDDNLAVVRDFAFDNLAALRPLAKLDGNVEFVRASVRVASGATDLSFIHSVNLAIASADPDSTLPTLDAYDCAGDCFSGDSLALTSVAKDNVLQYLGSDALAGSIKLTGQLPTTAWTMDITVCMRGKLSHDVNP